VTKELKQRIGCPPSKAKTLLKQRFDFPFEKKIKTTDRLPTMQSTKIFKKVVRFSILERI